MIATKRAQSNEKWQKESKPLQRSREYETLEAFCSKNCSLSDEQGLLAQPQKRALFLFFKDSYGISINDKLFQFGEKNYYIVFSMNVLREVLKDNKDTPVFSSYFQVIKKNCGRVYNILQSYHKLSPN